MSIEKNRFHCAHWKNQLLFTVERNYMLYAAEGSRETAISDDQLADILNSVFTGLGKRNSVLAVPPDSTRIHSRAGFITEAAWRFYGDSLSGILPALGTHQPMGTDELSRMFPAIPRSLFRVHNWREDTETLGSIPGKTIETLAGGGVSFPWPVQVNRLISRGKHDLVLSIGQVVPHEVTGMANYSKNILIGTGGQEAIDRSHYLGAVYGIEKILGRRDNPVRTVLNTAAEQFLKDIPILYILTVVSPDDSGSPVLKGIFIGDDEECFSRACTLSEKVNITWLDNPLDKIIVYLDPEEYKSTWLGNKAVYRTRMAIRDGGELIILAPGVKTFGEDSRNDTLIREFGYRGTETIKKLVSRHPNLQANLSAAAHLIHGSTEGRFSVTWCPGKLSRKEIESAGYRYGDLDDFLDRYPVSMLAEGFNTLPSGEELFFIRNPGLGLWRTI